jgi:XTP/dITP diphosphohydrolase
MEMLIASNNQHKIVEIQNIFPSIKVHSPKDLGIEFDHDETALTFHDNALEKAQSLYLHLAEHYQALAERYLVIADDSGLCVDVLAGAPGIYSARYGSTNGTLLSAEAKNALVLAQLQGMSNRNAHFSCAMAAVFGIGDFAIVQAIWPGEIIKTQPSGTGGFGYDPIVYLPDQGCTVAELSNEKKAMLSHRGQAARRLKAIIDQRLAEWG